jgi:endoglucanase
MSDGTGRRARPRTLAVLAILVLAGAVLAGVATFGTRSHDSAREAAAYAGLHVSGNRLLDATGHVVVFHGVNRSGTEYACIQGWGIFDGPSDAASVRAIASWHVNVVRIPLNEDCWLGINGVKPRYAGANYRRAIVSYVRLLHRYGMYAELSLIWGAPGTYPATYQSGSPDEAHSPAMWASLARTFRDDPNVVLAPWGETVTDAGCFLRGGVCEATFGPHNVPYRTAGMQQAVDVMRAAGYTGVIAIPGIAYANDLSRWLTYEPRDPSHQLIAEAHVYGKNVCDTVRCFQATYAPVAKRVPLVFGETGESYDASDCGSDRIATILGWADAHHVGYEAWAWDTTRTCLALIASYSGRPHGAYGAWIKAHYAGHPVALLPAGSRS